MVNVLIYVPLMTRHGRKYREMQNIVPVGMKENRCQMLIIILTCDDDGLLFLDMYICSQFPSIYGEMTWLAMKCTSRSVSLVNEYSRQAPMADPGTNYMLTSLLYVNYIFFGK